VRIHDASFGVLDTESTGLSAKDGHALVEVSARRLWLRSPWDNSDFSTLVDPERDIPDSASAVHHLTNADVAGYDRAAFVLASLHAFLADAEVLVAHNAEHDKQFLPNLTNRKWLCLYRLAMHVFPDASDYKLQTLRYYIDRLNGTRDGARLDLAGLDPHRALADVIVAEFVLRSAIRKYLQDGGKDDIDALIAYAESPTMLAVWPFGKFKGQPISAAPNDYLRWILGPRCEMEKSRDLVFTLECELQLRQRQDAEVRRGVLAFVNG